MVEVLSHSIVETDRKRKADKEVMSSEAYREYRLKWDLAGREYHDFDFPIHMDLETTSVCNFRCVMCPQSYDREGIDFGFMSLDLFKKVIDEGVQNGLCSVKFNWRGEPFLNPDIYEMIKYAKDKGIIETMTNTNGSLLTKENCKKIIEAGLDKIIISIEGATKETYEKIRILGNYDILTRNIENLIEMKEKLGSRKPYIRVQTVRMKETATEVDAFVEKWKDKVDYVSINEYSNRGESKDRTAGIYMPVGRKPCPQIWQRLMIAWNGDVMMCCSDWYKKNCLGNVNNTSAKEIWHGQKLESIRKLHLQSRLDLVAACKDCNIQDSYVFKLVDQKEISTTGLNVIQ